LSKAPKIFLSVNLRPGILTRKLFQKLLTNGSTNGSQSVHTQWSSIRWTNHWNANKRSNFRMAFSAFYIKQYALGRWVSLEVTKNMLW